MLSKNEMKRRQERVLTLLQQENRWISTTRVATGSNLSYDTVRPVLAVLLKQGLVEFHSGACNVRLWGLAGLSTREQAARLETLEQQKINREQNRIARECRKDGLELDEHRTWLEAVARQKAWRKQMVLLENRR